MLFQSPLFALHLLSVLLLLVALPSRTARHSLLLLASYVFYGAWDVRFLSLLMLSTLVDYVAGRRLHSLVEAGPRKRWLAASVATNLGILGVFKYFNFFVENAAELASTFGVELSYSTMKIVLPVGISFYTFQSMSYTIDIYRRKIQPESSLLRFALYVAFFPQLVAGPIVRARHFLPQLNRDEPPRLRNLPSGALLFAVGLFKKVAIADQLATVVDPVFATPELYGSGALVLASFANVLQITCDFSGYSDMAIGLGRILGYRLRRNFDRPHSSRTFRELWQRWHISLSTWLRDYLYFSLGGNRKGRVRTHVHMLLTMTLGGLWHGASWTFVFWGFAHGVLLSIERLRNRARDPGLMGWLSVQAWWTLLAICFRSETLSDALAYTARMASFRTPLEALDPGRAAFLIGLMAIAVLDQSSLGARLDCVARRSHGMLRMLLAGAIVALAYAISPGENRAFVYFQF